MEDFYIINDKYVQITLEKELYPVQAIQKAISNFFDKAFVKMTQKGKNKLMIYILLKDDLYNIKDIVGEFYNELLREVLRYNISLETKNMRELIVGRALYSTCINIKKPKNNKRKTEEVYNINDIAINWFEKQEENKC